MDRLLSVPGSAWRREEESFVALSCARTVSLLPGAVALRVCAWGTPVLERWCQGPRGLGVGREQLQPQATFHRVSSKQGGCVDDEITPRP